MATHEEREFGCALKHVQETFDLASYFDTKPLAWDGTLRLIEPDVKSVSISKEYEQSTCRVLVRFA